MPTFEIHKSHSGNDEITCDVVQFIDGLVIFSNLVELPADEGHKALFNEETYTGHKVIKAYNRGTWDIIVRTSD